MTAAAQTRMMGMQNRQRASDSRTMAQLQTSPRVLSILLGSGLTFCQPAQILTDSGHLKILVYVALGFVNGLHVGRVIDMPGGAESKEGMAMAGLGAAAKWKGNLLQHAADVFSRRGADLQALVYSQRAVAERQSGTAQPALRPGPSGGGGDDSSDDELFATRGSGAAQQAATAAGGLVVRWHVASMERTSEQAAPGALECWGSRDPAWTVRVCPQCGP